MNSPEFSRWELKSRDGKIEIEVEDAIEKLEFGFSLLIPCIFARIMKDLYKD
jgi:hypothetical protein